MKKYGLSNILSSGEVQVADEAQIINYVQWLLQYAMEQGASDIHIEPLERGSRVRLRVDGFLQVVAELSLEKHRQLLSRCKVLSDLDIAEQRLPQDGRAEFNFGEKKLDVRISTLPTIHGEKMVIRLLDRDGALLDLQGLSFTATNLANYEKLYRAPHGMILVTGPTGSGKSTTLYATLQLLNVPEKNIITIEDPVEYLLPGINQVAVNKKIGLTFASGLRSIVRQDPNIIMVGEIRDRETAEIAVQAALTGHLVFSTLHTNDAVGAVTRLVDLGIEPFLVASALRGVVGQRLLRQVCPHCRHTRPATRGEKQYLRQPLEQELLLEEGSGCEYCHGSGYKGRLAVQELLLVDAIIRNLISRKAEEKALLAVASQQGFIDLFQDAVTKVLQGRTTVAELVRQVAF